MSPYEILGVKRGSDKERVVSAYRKLAKQYHPDANPNDPKASDRFAEINNAYQAILKELDNPSPVNSFFNPAKPNRPKRTNRIIQKEITISLNEAINGTVYVVEGGSGPCLDCHGEGFHRSKHVVRCDVCNGSGVSGYGERGIIQVKLICDHCAGSGKTTRIRCHTCYGFGSSPKHALNVEIPKGTLDGDVLLVEGGANDPEGNVVGDLELTVKIAPNGVYRTNGIDIETRVVVDVWDAALGSQRTVKSPDGTQYKLNIPAGTAHGTKFTLQGQGIRKLLEDGETGNLVAILAIKIPDASAGKEKEAYERLRDSLNG